MDSIVSLLLEWGLMGMVIAAFTESFISPVLPDVILIPLALAKPDMAIYYGVIATLVSVLGGCIGYWIGYKWGMPVVHKVMSDKYAHKLESFAHSENVSWTIFLAAMSPIPYKFVSISAGAFRVKWSVFMFASFFGRMKRFLLEGLVIYFFGEPAIRYLQNSTKEMVIISVVFVLVIGAGIYFYRKWKHSKTVVE